LYDCSIKLGGEPDSVVIADYDLAKEVTSKDEASDRQIFFGIKYYQKYDNVGEQSSLNAI
jgi:hypothetical protein